MDIFNQGFKNKNPTDRPEITGLSAGFEFEER
jgi:hypothetical protein